MVNLQDIWKLCCRLRDEAEQIKKLMNSVSATGVNMRGIGRNFVQTSDKLFMEKDQKKTILVHQLHVEGDWIGGQSLLLHQLSGILKAESLVAQHRAKAIWLLAIRDVYGDVEIKWESDGCVVNGEKFVGEI